MYANGDFHVSYRRSGSHLKSHLLDSDEDGCTIIQDPAVVDEDIKELIDNKENEEDH